MGANIKVQSDSQKFQQEMKQIAQDLRVMSSELSTATTKAELFGTEQDKLSAKSKELTNSIKGQNTIFDLHKQAINTLTGDIQKYKDRNTELSKSIADVENKLKESIKSTGEDSKETKQLQQELSKLQQEYNKNEKAIDKSNKQVDNYKIKLNETERAILQAQKALEETDKKLANMKWDNASKSLESFGNKTKQIGQDLTTKVTLPILAAGGASVKLASDMSESLNKVDVAFGNNSSEIKKWSDTTLTNFGLAKSTSLDMAATYGDMATSMSFTTAEASKMSQAIVGRAADLSSFKNIRIDVAKTALNSIFSGETESLKQLGVVMTQVNLQEFAYSQGIKKKIQDMTQQEQVQLRFNYVMEKTKNAQGDFARTSDGVANSTRVTSETIKELGAEFGQNLLPIIASILKPLNELLKGLSDMSPTSQKIIIVIGAILAILPPLLIIIGTLITSIGAIIGAVTVAGGAIALLTSPITITIAAIVALIAIGVLLWKNWDTIKLKASELGNDIKEKFNKIKESIMSPIRSASEFVGEQINKIKSFFSGLKLELPKFKIPHFSLQGEFSLMPPKIPKVGVEWYAEGGIMTQPTLFGINGSNEMVGGEAGAEGIIPLKALWSELSKNFDKLEQRLNNNKQQQPIYITVVSELEGREIARGTAKYINEELAYLDKNNNFGLGGV